MDYSAISVTGIVATMSLGLIYAPRKIPKKYYQLITLSFLIIFFILTQLISNISIQLSILVLVSLAIHRIYTDNIDYVSVASHQLRTPLSTAKNYAVLLEAEDLGSLNKSQKTATAEIQSSVNKMVRIIEEILDTAKISAGTLTLVKDSFDLTTLVRREVRKFLPFAKKKNIYIEKSLSPVNAYGDLIKIQNVVSNFIDNAIQYSPENTTIQIRTYIDGQSACFEVQDQGIGVDSKVKTKIFNKYWRANNAKQVRPEGTGLGLFVSKKIIELHSGEIIFESNKGSIFGFKIPIDK